MVDDKRILKFLGDEMTIRLRGLKDVKELRFYWFSKKRICIQFSETLLPEVWMKEGGPTLKLFEMDKIQQMVDWLTANGAKEIKKPKPYKPSRSIYD